MSTLSRCLAAGAAGTAAINLASYLDMAIRDRDPSDVPGKTVDAIRERLRWSATGENRRSAYGALLGYLNGLGVAIAYGFVVDLVGAPPAWLRGVLVGGVSMAATDVATTRLGVTHPADWSATDWLADLIPHLIYGMTVVTTYATLEAGDLA